MSIHISTTSSLSILQPIFPGRIQIDASALAGVLGISVKTINNLGDKFPIRPVRFGRSKFYRLVDVAAHIDNSLGISPISTSLSVVESATKPAVESKLTIPKRKRGRPSKAEQAERSQQSRLDKGRAAI